MKFHLFLLCCAVIRSASADDSATNAAALKAIVSNTDPSPRTDLFQMKTSLRDATSAAATSKSSDTATNGTVGDRPVISNHFTLSVDLDDVREEQRARQSQQFENLTKPAGLGTFDVAGQHLKVTQGPTFVNFDPMMPESDRQVIAEGYQRIELSKDANGLFYSRNEGFGCHVTKVSPDAAVFLRASENSVSIKFSKSFSSLNPFAHD